MTSELSERGMIKKGLYLQKDTLTQQLIQTGHNMKSNLFYYSLSNFGYKELIEWNQKSRSLGEAKS